MDLAERFSLPLVTLVDTPGAYPGLGAEQRGQAEAIARSIDKGLSLNVPSIALVIGEGGSGGAIAIASASRVLMLEHSVYSVISPKYWKIQPMPRMRLRRLASQPAAACSQYC